jgi:uncharacterized protein
MAVAGLLALLDDIATILDDVAVLTKVAAKKTAGIVGDDLALNAKQLVGFAARREIPVVLAVARGSLLNKAILVPAALAISAFAPWAVLPLLMAGGLYLCYEGVEKILHDRRHSSDRPALENIADPAVYEQDKIKGAVRTDFILSAEIIVITLGAIATADFMTQVSVLVIVALAMTIGVYGLVALIVKLDDFGLWLKTRPDAVSRYCGDRIVSFAPLLLKAIAVLGTAAMFLVGGGIMVHGIPGLEHGLQEFFRSYLPQHGLVQSLAGGLTAMLAGVVAGLGAVGVMKTVAKLRRQRD